MNLLIRNKNGFTLVELMLAMTVFAIIMTSVLLSVQNLSIARIKTENRVKLLEELYYFSEQLVNNVKDGGTIDYEEYWNRQSHSLLIGSGTIAPLGTLGSYVSPTGVGNYGSGGVLGSTGYGEALYYCVSGSGSTFRIKSGSGCLTGYNNIGTASGTPGGDYTLRYQRYGQYALQFMDYNSNADTDNDGGDEDGNGSIIDDEDDKDLGNAPTVLSGSIPELYLINPLEKTRMYFRYIIRQDTQAFSGGALVTCVVSSTGVTNDGCVGNVQILKMNGQDIGYNHSGTSIGAYDGKIDTWVLHPDWPGGVAIPTGQLATGTGNEWVDLFPNEINVKSLQFHLYPKKDPWLSWSEQDCNTGSPASCVSPFIHPYVRIQMSVGFAWGKRRTLKNDDPTISINTTVSLGDRE